MVDGFVQLVFDAPITVHLDQKVNYYYYFEIVAEIVN
jgi:hypothetical protein